MRIPIQIESLLGMVSDFPVSLPVDFSQIIALDRRGDQMLDLFSLRLFQQEKDGILAKVPV